MNHYDYRNMSVQELNAAIAEVSEILAKATSEFNHHGGELTRIQQLMIPLQEELLKLRQARALSENIRSDLKPKIAENRDMLNRLEHELRRAQLRELENKERIARFNELDALTIGAPWREFAFEHQIHGAKLATLVGGRAILGDQRGLGKTLTSLIMCDMRKSEKIVIIAPKETLSNFEDEIREWAKHRKLFSLAGKTKMAREFALSVLSEASQFILCINLEAWRKDKTLIPQIIKLQLDTVIIDEAHYCKDPEGLAFDGVRRIVYAKNKCVLCGGSDFAVNDTTYKCMISGCNGEYDAGDDNICSVKTVLPMSGTTILNRPQELWPLLHLVDRKSFPTEKEFLKFYCEKDYGFWRFKYGGETALLDKIGSQYIRRDRKSAGIIIPPQKIQNYELILDPEKYPKQYRAYQELKQQWMIFAESGDAISVSAVITQLLRMRQLITWPMGIRMLDPETKRVLFECDVAESVKMDFCADLTKELITEEEERVIVFSQFVAPLKEMKRRLEEADIRTALMIGDTPDWRRDEIRYDFDKKTASETNYKWDAVLCHYKVGGQSINLTAAAQTVVMDRQWNPGMEDQAFGRNDRIGQTKETTVHLPHVLNTVDMWLNKLIAAKSDLISGFDVKLHSLMAEINKGLKDGTI